MSVENPFEKSDEPTPEEIREFTRSKLMENRDLYKEQATELQKNVAEAQSAKLETLLYRLMNRTKDNPELVNKMNNLLDALDHQSRFGEEDKKLAPGRQEDLTHFLEEAGKALRWTVGGGNRPTDIDVDLSKWNMKGKK